MRILFTGGGTGGHFYPIISIVEEIEELIKEKRLLKPELFYMSTDPYNPGLLYEHSITFKKVTSGKLRRYFSLLNFLDLFKLLWGTISAVYQVYKIYPDVVFGKGGYASFPALFAAKILHIPVVIHESDTVPGRLNAWAGKFAARVAVSYQEASQYFPAGKAVYTGQPVRKDIAMPITEGAREFLKLEEDVPVVLILGGSQGAQIINETILEALPKMVENFSVLHQTGKKNFEEIKSTSQAVLHGSEHESRYKPFDYLNPLALRMAAGVSSVVISRAGSTIFEIAAWRVPAIIIPITNSNGDHQRKNAFNFARAGGCSVVQESNLSANIIISEVERLTTNETERQRMKEADKVFYKPDAAKKVAEEIVKIALSHEIEK